ncbi:MULTISPECIES: hypothetical protein [Rhizobium]|uniref:Transmembrane protein n=1 Tax=Rhizobium metallidurans TaxID=1265931 RepID=A0A7W6GC23_9HYPH|nr:MULTISPECIES: hypothetical protein [Rhizobium]MBB3965364.1 hypothetical protein [Rhizobium metallidurans]
MKRTLGAAMAAIFIVAGGLSPAMARDNNHRDNTGRAIAGGVAAGVVGGLIGGAIANSQPRYAEPAPRPRCWYEDREVGNSYDGGSHVETVRVCR